MLSEQYWVWPRFRLAPVSPRIVVLTQAAALTLGASFAFLGWTLLAVLWLYRAVRDGRMA